MAAEQKQLYRTRDGLIAGVCGGIARYFNIDAGVLRLFAVLLAVLTCGVLVLIYLVLWLILPIEPRTAETVDVDPSSIASEVYDQVVSGTAKTQPPSTPAVDSGHMPPPRPPEAADRRSPGYVYSAYSATPTAPFAPATSTQPPSDSESKKPFGAAAPDSYVPTTAKCGLVAGVVLVTIGLAVLISNWIHVFSPLQFWPLLLVAAGIVRMVIPDKRGYQMGDLLLGMFLFVCGTMLLLQTLGVLVYDIDSWFEEAWPILAIAAGTFLLGAAYKAPALYLTCALLVLLFCILGMTLYAGAGPAQSVWVALPFDQGITLDWRG